MKRKISCLLLFIMLLTLFTSCGKKEKEESVSSFKTGILSHMIAASGDQIMGQHILEMHNSEFQGDGERILYNNISSALLALNSDQIQIFATNSATADYIVSTNDNLMSFIPPGTAMQTELSMLTMEDNTETYNILNDAIIALKENGTMAQLIETYINSPDGVNQNQIELPFTEGAKTIRIAITGDIPPMDYVSLDGSPAGFNIALLAEISKQAGVNIDIVTMESTSRATALATDKVDAIFWVCATLCKEHPEIRIVESIENTIATEPYIILDAAMVKKK